MRVRNRTFWLITILAPIAYLLLMLSPILLNNLQSSEKLVAIIDKEGFLGNLKDPKNEKIYFEYPQINEEELVENYNSLGYKALVYIPKQGSYKDFKLKIYSLKPLGLGTKSAIKQIIQKRVEKQRIKDFGLSVEDFRSVTGEIDLVEVVSEKEAKTNTEIYSLVSTIGAAFIILLMTLYGTMVMRGVMEEKKNRIVEVLLSSIKPFELMFGKIIGIGLVGISQFAFWTGLIITMNLLIFPFIGLAGNDIIAPSADMSSEEIAKVSKLIKGIYEIEWGQYAVILFLYFMGGYFLYASLYAGVGAMLNDENEMQTMGFLLSMPIIIALLLISYAVKEPQSTLVFWTSLFPFFSPVLMIAIWPFVPLWHIVLSFVLLIMGVLLMSYFGAKIYRLSILLYGQKPTVQRLVKLLFN
ncbi:MAG TPA: ABC transporter permease [Bacteroidetes bacterium]|nr:ABC transporter permease [Bacteroidota bacterium]